MDGEDEGDEDEEDTEYMRLCRRGHALIWALTEKCVEGVTDFSMSRRLAWRQRLNSNARRFRHRRSLDVVARASRVAPVPCT